MIRSLAIAFFALAGCATSVSDPDPLPNLPDDRPGVQVPDPVLPPSELVPLATDFCDDYAHPGETWLSHSSPHFTLSYLQDTPAERDRVVIATRLESAYTAIRAQLDITAEPTFTVNLSPNRYAAALHGRGFGRGWADQNRYDVIYTGAADSYEVQRYGQLLTLMLNYHLDAANRNRVSLLTTGIAEYLDQSGRDQHVAYALQLDAGIESRVRLAEFDAKDVQGRNVGRAGSFVQFLVERYGIEVFADIFRATAVNWNGSCYAHQTYGCVSTPEQLTAMLDGVIASRVGEGWATLQPLWQEAVEDALDRELFGMGPTATSQIQNVLRTMDKAVALKDPSLYRSTMEGFYCDWGGEDLRVDIAARAVTAYGQTTSKVIALFDTGIKNFSTAQALVQRTDEHGASTFGTLLLEHFPLGWRVTYGPDWY
jgi:hypothetical protein